jgi:hypothetical protein
VAGRSPAMARLTSTPRTWRVYCPARITQYCFTRITQRLTAKSTSKSNSKNNAFYLVRN